MDDGTFADAFGDALVQAFSKVTDAAVDLKVYEKTGGQGLPQWAANDQMRTQPINAGPIAADPGGAGFERFLLPGLALLLGAAILWRLAAK